MFTEIPQGTLISNRYLIEKILGQGGFGRTYLAFDTWRFNEACVLKEFVPATTKADIIRKSRELFEREAKVLYQLQHPQIPQFLALLTDNQRVFIIQQYIDGKNYSQILSERLSKKGKPFSETEVRAWLLDMLPVLEYIHDRNIIHRDISLDNVMLPHNQSKPVLIDFGVVKEKFTQILTEQSLHQHSFQDSVVGKIGYSPPEQLRLGQCYPSSDVYGLAVTAIVLLTARMPYLLMDKSLKWQWHSYAKISDSLVRILDKMLAEAPTDRYQSAKEVVVELNNHHHTPFSFGRISSLLPKKPQTNTTHLQKLGFSQSSTRVPDSFLEKPTKISPAQSQQKAFQNKDLEELLILEELEKKLSQADETDTEQYIQTPVSHYPDFLDLVGRELTSFVGPFATVLMKHTLEQSPQMAKKEFIEALVKAIPDPQQAQEFKKSIPLGVEPNSQKLENAVNLPSPQGNYPAISNPEFLENCRRELTSFVGPFASVILEHTLDQHPNLTPKQLIETLVAEIPNQERAKKFKERIQKLNEY